MWGCCNRAASLISRSNRSTDTPALNSGEQLHDDTPAQSRFFGKEHPRHAATAELALDGVGGAKRLP